MAEALLGSLFVQASFPVVGSISFDPRSRDEVEFIVREIALDGAYLAPPIELGPGAVVVDAGANIGVFSLVLLQKIADCRILAFEPVPSTFAHLQANLGDRAELFPLALGRAPGRAQITLYPALPANATLHPENKAEELALFKERSMAGMDELFRPFAEQRFEELFASEIVDCEIVTLSSIARDLPRIDLLKIDVEGAEREVLDGIDEDTWPKIRQIALESGDEPSARQLAELLEARGYLTVCEQPAWAAHIGLPNHEVRATREIR